MTADLADTDSSSAQILDTADAHDRRILEELRADPRIEFVELKLGADVPTSGGEVAFFSPRIQANPDGKQWLIANVIFTGTTIVNGKVTLTNRPGIGVVASGA